MQRAYVSYASGDYVAALHDCSATLDRLPARAEAHWLRGACLYRLGQFFAAGDDFQCAIEADAANLTYIAWTRVAIQRSEAILRRSLEKFPQNEVLRLTWKATISDLKRLIQYENLLK